MGAYAQLDELLKLRLSCKKLQLRTAHLSRSRLNGAFQTRFKGRGMEFEEVRHYQPGDDIRSIDWRVTARTQKTHTKLFCEEREKPVFIVADQRPNMFFGSRHFFKSSYAAHIAGALGWIALQQNDRVGGMVFDGEKQTDIRPKRHQSNQLAWLHCLLEYNHRLTAPIARQPTYCLSQQLADTHRIAKPGSAVFIVSDFYGFDSACEKPLYRLAQHTELMLFHVTDPIEKTLPNLSDWMISDGQQRVSIHAKGKKVRQHHRHHFEERQEHLTLSAQKLGIPLVEASISPDPMRLIRTLFGQNGGRR